jgi:hypothetical protein
MVQDDLGVLEMKNLAICCDDTGNEINEDISNAPEVVSQPAQDEQPPRAIMLTFVNSFDILKSPHG